MATKAEMYREMADHATEKLTAQVTEWIKFLLMAGRLHKYESFLDLSMVYMQKSTSSAIAEYETWPRIGRYVRRGAKGIALLRYRNGRAFLRYVFDVSDTGRREDGRDPVLWQYRDEYGPAVTARLEEAFGVPGGDGLAKQLVALAIQFADERWHDFHDRIMLSLRDSAMDGMDEDNAGLRFRNAVTVSLSFLLMARCGGFDLDSYFTPEDLRWLCVVSVSGSTGQPQPEQNFASSESSLPHLEQYDISLPPAKKLGHLSMLVIN